MSGVETTQPDKGTEMFLCELGVDESARGRGLGRTLVAALGYERAGAHGSSSHLMFEWGFTPS